MHAHVWNTVTCMSRLVYYYCVDLLTPEKSSLERLCLWGTQWGVFKNKMIKVRTKYSFQQVLNCHLIIYWRVTEKLNSPYRYSAGEEKSPLFIFLHDQLPFFLGETGRNSGKFLQVSPGNPIFSPGNTCISPWNFKILPIKLHVYSEKLWYFSLKFLWEISCFSLKF